MEGHGVRCLEIFDSCELNLYSITIWGLVFQIVTFAVVAPIYFAVHLLTSPTFSFGRQWDFLPHPAKLQSIPYSIAIGFVTPTILAALPAPSVISYEKKQLFIAIWQAFPLWVGICQIVLPVLRSLFIDDVTPKRTNKQIIDSMRRIYATMLVVAIVTRISTWTISISAILFPGIFAPEVGNLLKPSNVFGPAAATPSVKMPSLAAGSFQLLQYDEMIGGAAMVLWSASLYTNAIGSKGLADWAWLAMKGIVILALAGPQGLAVAAVWARDEIIFASDNQKTKSL